MKAFSYEALPGRVVFGAGTRANLKDELERLQLARIFLITTGSAASHLSALRAQIGERLVGVIDRVVQHVPAETVAAALAQVRESRATGLVTLGGGSAIGLGKALARETALPLIAIPTTFSGSEMTPIYGITSEGRKKTGRDLRVLPRLVIYDPELCYSLPPALAISSGLNGLAHCVEALYGAAASPISDLMAEEGSRALAQGLSLIQENPANHDGYDLSLYGAYLGGAVLANVGTALHHRICHVLGGSFNLPHAETHSVILPYAARYNQPAAPAAMARLAHALGVTDAVAGLFELSARLGAPNNLAALGMPKSGLEVAAQQIVELPPVNPRLIEKPGVLALLQAAYYGSGPQA